MIVLDDIIIKGKERENYAALGSFDGLHYGHISLIRKSVELAALNNGNSMVFTYKNHPKTLIDPKLAPKLIMNIDTKLDILEKEHIDIVVLKSFTKGFMKMSPEEFIKSLCIDYNVKAIVVGFNFRFGYKNLGDINLLEGLKSKYGYELYVLDAYSYKGDVVSSTRIRKCILEGNIKEARKMLLEPYMIKGSVSHGKKLGRTIGFPTANLSYDDNMLIPNIGVYYTNVVWKGKKYKAITSIGNNPTVNGKELTIESYILDFNNEIYGQEIKVYFIDRLRNAKKFDSLNALVEQLKRDKEIAISKNMFI